MVLNGGIPFVRLCDASRLPAELQFTGLPGGMRIGCVYTHTIAIS
jgi:hypothetical protein